MRLYCSFCCFLSMSSTSSDKSTSRFQCPNLPRLHAKIPSRGSSLYSFSSFFASIREIAFERRAQTYAYVMPSDCLSCLSADGHSLATRRKSLGMPAPASKSDASFSKCFTRKALSNCSTIRRAASRSRHVSHAFASIGFHLILRFWRIILYARFRRLRIRD